MKQYNVLVFPCGTEIANEIISALENNKYFRLYFSSSDDRTYCNYLGKPVYKLPYVNEVNFISELRDLVNRLKIDFIIPANDDVALILSQTEDLEPIVVGQSREVNEIVRFKDKTYEYFSDILPIAKIYKCEEDLEFPIFVKPKRGHGSKKSFVIKNMREFRSFKELYSFDDFVYMEFLEGDEFTIDCFSDNGNLLYSGARLRERIKRGISVQSAYVTDDKLQKIFRNFAEKISNKLNLHGLWFYQMNIIVMVN